MLAASLNAFFCASPIYGSAEDFTFLLDVTVSREVTPAAKQQIGETRKKRLAQRLAFFRFDNSFGIIKGEQPLIRASRASKVAGAFLVLFCARKRVHTRRRCILQKALNFKHATTLCAGNLYFSTFRLCRVQNSFAGCRLRAGLCQLPGGGTGS